MNTKDLILRRLSIIALLALCVLAILGGIYYHERAIFSDAALRLFNIINYFRLDVPGNRYGAGIVQLLPYLAQRLHLSINVILFCYSVSFNLFYLLVASLLVFRYKQYPLAILMVLYYFLFVTESYIWVSETFLGVAWMFLFYAVTLYLGNRKANLFILLLPFSLLAFLTVFSHFVVIIPTAFLWLYLIIDRKNWPFSGKVTILLSCVLIGIIFLKWLDTSSQQYDVDHLRGITHSSLKDIIDSFFTPVVEIFIYRCLVNYWIGVLVFLVSLVSLIKSRKVVLAILTFLACMGYIVIMGLTYGGDLDGKILLFHIESEWACIGVIVSAGFVFEFLPRAKPLISVGLLIGIFMIRLVYIYVSLPPFTYRLHVNEQILGRMRKKGITRLVLINDSALVAINKLYWALPYETTMMSAIDKDRPQLTFFFVNIDDKKTQDQIKTTKGYYNCYILAPLGKLNPQYFATDTIHPYFIMTYEDLMR